MILPEFKYHQPTSVEEALEVARSCDEDFDFIAGGTDVLPNYKNRLNNRKHLISLSNVKELRKLEPLSIGSMVTLAEIEKNDPIKKQFPVIASAAREVATPLLRESATIGGNVLLDTRCWFFNQSFLWRESKKFCLKADGADCLVVPQKEVCYATYSGDLSPVLMALGATFHFAGTNGARDVDSTKFFTHDGIERNVKSPHEILTHISLPETAKNVKAEYQKLRIRDAMDYPVMGVAISLSLVQKKIEALRIAITGTGTTPFIYDGITAQYIGKELAPSLIEQISKAVMQEVTPYKNVHFSPQYRKAMSGVYIKRMLSRLAA